ncbi:MAG: hypothetical protein OXI87_04205 [Albidovulum sp.]|nr:hypothetical protein [Albidovulum sp.]
MTLPQKLSIIKIFVNSLGVFDLIASGIGFLRAALYKDGNITIMFTLDPGFATQMYLALFGGGLAFLIMYNWKWIEFLFNWRKRRKKREVQEAVELIDAIRGLWPKVYDWSYGTPITIDENSGEWSEFQIYVNKLTEYKLLPKDGKEITVKKFKLGLDWIYPVLKHNGLAKARQEANKIFKAEKKKVKNEKKGN